MLHEFDDKFRFEVSTNCMVSFIPKLVTLFSCLIACLWRWIRSYLFHSVLTYLELVCICIKFFYDNSWSVFFPGRMGKIISGYEVFNGTLMAKSNTVTANKAREACWQHTTFLSLSVSTFICNRIWMLRTTTSGLKRANLFIQQQQLLDLYGIISALDNLTKIIGLLHNQL